MITFLIQKHFKTETVISGKLIQMTLKMVIGNQCLQNPNGWLTNGWLERRPLRNIDWPLFSPKAHVLIACLARSKWVIRPLIDHLDDSRWVISTGAFGVKKRSFIVPRPLYAHRPSPNRPLGFWRNGNEGVTADAKTVTVTIIQLIHPNFKTVTVTVIWGK